MNVQTFQAEIESTYEKHFPFSRVSVTYRNSLYQSVYINCFLSGSNEEVANKIIQNDLFSIMFKVLGENSRELPKLNADTELPEILTFENCSKSYHTKPKNKMYAFDSKQLSFRKVSGNAEKIIQSFDKFLIQLKNSLIEDLNNDNIPDYSYCNQTELLRSKLVENK